MKTVVTVHRVLSLESNEHDNNESSTMLTTRTPIQREEQIVIREHPS